MLKQRYLETDINNLSFANDKMAFVSGPRQCGKTTMAKHMLATRQTDNYYNWDEINFRKLWTKNPAAIIPIKAAIAKPLLVLDEIHKAKSWKRTVKGLYDSLKSPCDILITGSARLNVYRKGSDSLLGRYHHFRLHPFSLAELLNQKTPELKDLLNLDHLSANEPKQKNAQHYFANLKKYGPFPEPFSKANEQLWNLWRHGRIEKIVREDLRDLSHLPELSQLEMLAALLPERAAQLLSIQSLSEDLEVAYTTVKRWLNYFRELYYHFEIKPYTKSLTRSIKKTHKLYLWDWSEITNETARFENLIASHLLKYCHYLTDVGAGIFELCYLRNKEQQEIDFLIVKDGKPWLPIEVKLNDVEVSANWHIFLPKLSCAYGIQITQIPNIYFEKKIDSQKVIVTSAEDFLQKLI